MGESPREQTAFKLEDGGDLVTAAVRGERASAQGTPWRNPETEARHLPFTCLEEVGVREGNGKAVVWGF